MPASDGAGTSRPWGALKAARLREATSPKRWRPTRMMWTLRRMQTERSMPWRGTWSQQPQQLMPTRRLKKLWPPRRLLSLGFLRRTRLLSPSPTRPRRPTAVVGMRRRLRRSWRRRPLRKLRPRPRITTVAPPGAEGRAAGYRRRRGGGRKKLAARHPRLWKPNHCRREESPLHHRRRHRTQASPRRRLDQLHCQGDRRRRPGR
mmetsp:Transcript_1623/g.3729  ORF Transcript_1623/g.3729 Transcript_1623/m.3729 type:complete len:204 (-) Transcript_1623:729-1340(-)